MAAGTNGGAPVFSTYYEHGINTILAMHVDPADLRTLEAMRLPAANLIITGHMPSDSIGLKADRRKGTRRMGDGVVASHRVLDAFILGRLNLSGRRRRRGLGN